MFKRTKGYFLLTMLVLTGLAGRLHTDTLSAKERHYLVTELKTSKTEFLKSIEGLSDRQLHFKSGKGQLTIQDFIYQLASVEKELWLDAKTSLKQEPQSLQKTVSDDQQLAALIQQEKMVVQRKSGFKNSSDVLKFYKSQRMQMIRYVQTTTENVRAHIVKTELGNFDVYQTLLLNTFYGGYYTQQIEHIKSNLRFPK